MLCKNWSLEIDSKGLIHVQIGHPRVRAMHFDLYIRDINWN